MKTVEFLQAIWPATGYYVIAIPAKITLENGTERRYYKHVICKSIEEAAAVAVAKDRDGLDVYFAVHSFKERSVLHPKTNKPGVRFGFNASHARCLILDLDVGDGPNKFPTREVAISSLRIFLRKHNLPKPTVVSSGNGFHIYFQLKEDVTSDEWHTLSLRLKLLAAAAEFKADPARTADKSSVLRVAGTHNYKRQDDPRQVEVLVVGKPVGANVLSALIESALQLYGESRMHNALTDSKKAADIILGNNVKKTDYPTLDFKKLALSCKQVGNVVSLRGNVTEPEWFHTLQVVRLCEDWRKAAHWLSKGHPKYDPVETDNKLDQLAQKEIGPTTCAVFDKNTKNGICQTCAHWGKISSPARISHAFKQAPAPTYIESTETVVIPDPPYPYIRLNSGKIGIRQKNENGNEIDPIIISDYDIFPERRVVNEIHEGERLSWRVHLPRVGWRTVEFDAEALYDSRTFVAAISKRGIYPAADMVSSLRNYMIAYIKELQRAADAERQFSRLGWRDNFSSFVYAGKEYLADGSVRPCTFDASERHTVDGVGVCSGTAERQLENLAFFEKKGYEPHQFCILAALGAPLMPATLHNGLIVNMSGDTGVGKSTALKMGASLWGNPAKLAINATSQGSTHLGLMHRLGIYSNLPFCVDEMTRRNHKEIGDLALSISQGVGKIRSTVNGGERRNIEQWSTIMLSTANTSFYNILSQERADSMAETMRVFEIHFTHKYIHTKQEADSLLVSISENYGHVADIFLRYVMPRREKVFEAVREMVRRIDAKAGTGGAERFWSAAIAVVLVAGSIAKKLGLINYRLEEIEQWVISTQIPSMRVSVSEQYTGGENLIAEFLEMNIGNTLVIDTRNAISVILEKPRGQLLCRHEYGTDLIYVLKKAFADHCYKVGANYSRVLQEMTADRVIINRNAKKVLGAGTDFSKGQSHCLLVNLKHPKLAGVASQVSSVAVNRNT